MPESSAAMHSNSTFQFATVKGVFAQDDPSTDPGDFDYSTVDFGLLDRKYPSDDGAGLTSLWARFNKYLQYLNGIAPPSTQYKLLYLGRHGQGVHNVAEEQYGTEEWDEYWSKLDGDGTMVWSDAHLTGLGRAQALHANDFFRAQLLKDMPAPQSYYASPLYRTLDTCRLTFSGLNLPSDRPYKPVIKELARETLGEHTCDRRSGKSVIQEAFPEFTLEPGFAEQDVLWDAHHRETHEEHDLRTRKLLQGLFEHDANTVVSITSHSGAIASILRVVSHRVFALQTGGLIPVVVKAERLSIA